MLSKAELEEIIDDLKELNDEGYDIVDYKATIVKDGLTRDGRIVRGIRITVDFMDEKEKWESPEISGESLVMFR